MFSSTPRSLSSATKSRSNGDTLHARSVSRTAWPMSSTTGGDLPSTKRDRKMRSIPRFVRFTRRTMASTRTAFRVAGAWVCRMFSAVTPPTKPPGTRDLDAVVVDAHHSGARNPKIAVAQRVEQRIREARPRDRGVVLVMEQSPAHRLARIVRHNPVEDAGQHHRNGVRPIGVIAIVRARRHANAGPDGPGTCRRMIVDEPESNKAAFVGIPSRTTPRAPSKSWSESSSKSPGARSRSAVERSASMAAAENASDKGASTVSAVKSASTDASITCLRINPVSGLQSLPTRTVPRPAVSVYGRMPGWMCIRISRPVPSGTATSSKTGVSLGSVPSYNLAAESVDRSGVRDPGDGAVAPKSLVANAEDDRAAPSVGHANRRAHRFPSVLGGPFLEIEVLALDLAEKLFNLAARPGHGRRPLSASLRIEVDASSFRELVESVRVE